MTTRATGDQYDIARGDQRAVVTGVGASLRVYTRDALDVVRPFAPDEVPPAFSGATLAPWPNRLRDGRYTWDGATRQVDLNEPARGTALHGLVTGVRFAPVGREPDRVSLEHTLVPTGGYPWPLRLTVTYALAETGLEVSVTARNEGSTAAPYGYGAHPWLAPGGRVDDCSLRVDAARHVVVDERLLPTGTEPVSGDVDLRRGRSLAGLALDDAWTGPARDCEGRTTVSLTRGDGLVSEVWADASTTAWQVCTGDGIDGIERTGVAVEPMTCTADAFRTGEELIRLEPGARHDVRWGLRLR